MDQSLLDLTYGVEIECITPSIDRATIARLLTEAGTTTFSELYGHSAREHWKVVSDGSLNSTWGAEIVSPVLHGQEGLDAINDVCHKLDEIRCTVNRSCGLHVHVGVRDDVELFKRLLASYHRYEVVIDGLMAPSRRANNNSYCRHVVYRPQVESAKNLNELRSATGRQRYVKLNIESYWRHGTVEFRHHQGSLNAEKVTRWTLFCLRFVRAAERTQSLRVLSIVNPRRVGTDAHRKFALYRDGMTMAQALEAGLNRADIRFDLAHGHVALDNPQDHATTLAGLLDRLEASPEERAYFTERARLFGVLDTLEGSEL